MAWRWGRGRREEPHSRGGDPVLEELAVQQEAINALSIQDFLAGVERYGVRAATPPRSAREHRTEVVRRARVDALARTGAVEPEAAAILVEGELSAGEAVVLDTDQWGRWPEQSAITRAADQTRAVAQQLPEPARAAVKVNVALVPGGEG